MTPEELQAIGDAVESVAACLSPEDRWDLRQDIALRLVEFDDEVENLPAFARRLARDGVSDFKRSEAHRREVERVYGANRSLPRYRHDSNWHPAWYPPHPDAERFVNSLGQSEPWHGQAWFACEGARVMHVKETKSYQDVELALVGFIDFASR